MSTVDANSSSAAGYTAESWERASKYAKLIGEIPASFSTTIRTVRTNNPESGTSGYDKSSRFMAMRLVKSATLKAPLYFAGCATYPEKLTSGKILTDTQLLELFQPHELASLLGMVYIFRRTRRVCSGALWDNLVREINSQGEIGLRLGKCIPKIGAHVGVVLGVVRNVSLGLILSRDEKGFRGYRREVNSKDVNFDLALEMATWGCDHTQIASKLLQSLGFGLQFAAGFSFGLTSKSQAELEADPEYYRWHVASVWSDALRKTAQAPQMTHKGQYYPLKADLDKLCAEVAQINSSGSKLCWIEKDKDALPPEMAGNRSAAPQAGSAAKETTVIEAEVPKEVIQEMAKEEEELDLE